MSTNKPRRAGAPAFPKDGQKLRLVRSPDERPRLTPAPELKELIDDMRRRSHLRRERESDGKDAA